MSSSNTSTAATVDPPCGWTKDEAILQRDYYLANDNSLKEVLETHYNLTAVSPVWARDPAYGSIQFIFEGKDNNRETSYYVWSGGGDTVALFEEKSLQKIRDDIVTHGEGEGYLGKLKLREL